MRTMLAVAVLIVFPGALEARTTPNGPIKPPSSSFSVQEAPPLPAVPQPEIKSSPLAPNSAPPATLAPVPTATQTADRFPDSVRTMPLRKPSTTPTRRAPVCISPGPRRPVGRRRPYRSRPKPPISRHLCRQSIRFRNRLSRRLRWRLHLCQPAQRHPCQSQRLLHITRRRPMGRRRKPSLSNRAHCPRPPPITPRPPAIRPRRHRDRRRSIRSMPPRLTRSALRLRPTIPPSPMPPAAMPPAPTMSARQETSLRDTAPMPGSADGYVVRNLSDRKKSGDLVEPARSPSPSRDDRLLISPYRCWARWW